MTASGITIRVPSSGRGVKGILRAISEGAYREAAGVAGAQVLQDHFAEKNLDSSSHKTANSLGATRGGLYEQFRDATSWQPTSDGFVISVAHNAIRQRLKGGTIYPSGRTSAATGKPIKHLAIPARGEAYGKLPSQMGILKVLFGKNGPYALAAANDYQRTIKRGKRKGDVEAARDVFRADTGGGGILFWLVDSVTQKPDPSVLPRRRLLLAKIKLSITAWFSRRYKGVS